MSFVFEGTNEFCESLRITNFSRLAQTTARHIAGRLVWSAENGTPRGTYAKLFKQMFGLIHTIFNVKIFDRNNLFPLSF